MQLEGLRIPISFDANGLNEGIGQITSLLGGPTAFGGIGKMYIDFLGDSIEEAANSETVHIRLAAALKATGRDAEMSAYQFDRIATSLSQVSAFDDESIKSAFQVLSQFPSIPTDSIETITKAAMDMSAAMGGNLATNAEAIGRALETGLIPRTWGFNAALKEQFKAQVEAGNSAAALSLVMDGLNSRYGGQAQAQIGTYNGQMMLLKNNWDNFKENIGGQYIPTLTSSFEWINKNFEAVTKLGNAVAWLVTPYAKAGDAIRGFIETLNIEPTGSLYVPAGGAGNAPRRTSNSGISAKAAGGSAGGLTWVGERGPELVNLPSGSNVNNAQASQSMGFDYYKLAAILAVEFAKARD